MSTNSASGRLLCQGLVSHFDDERTMRFHVFMLCKHTPVGNTVNGLLSLTAPIFVAGLEMGFPIANLTCL